MLLYTTCVRKMSCSPDCSSSSKVSKFHFLSCKNSRPVLTNVSFLNYRCIKVCALHGKLATELGHFMLHDATGSE